MYVEKLIELLRAEGTRRHRRRERPKALIRRVYSSRSDHKACVLR